MRSLQSKSNRAYPYANNASNDTCILCNQLKRITLNNIGSNLHKFSSVMPTLSEKILSSVMPTYSNDKRMSRFPQNLSNKDTFSSSLARVSLIVSILEASLNRVHPPPTTIPSLRADCKSIT